MTHSELKNAIFHRRSIRKYTLDSLPNTTLEQLQDFTHQLKALDDRIRYEFTFLETDDVKNLLPIKAPHYICLYSENKENYLMNAGFLLQQIDLYLSVNNLASCWLGVAKPSKELPRQRNGLEFVIMLAFGNTSEAVHRELSGFRRKELTDISNIAGADALLGPVRLAPSSSNTQPWYFSGNTDEMIVSRKKLNPLKAAFYGNMNQIDIGIALCHLWLAADSQGKQIRFDFNPAVAPAGYEFMVKALIG